MALKVFDGSGLAALGKAIREIKGTADSSMSAVSGLSGEVGTLAERTSAAFTEVVDSLEALESGKQEKSGFQTVAIPKSGWKSNTDTETKAAGYAYVYDAPVDGATAQDGGEGIISVSSMEAAAAAGVCATCDVLDGIVRFYAVNVPTTEITVQVRLIKG